MRCAATLLLATLCIPPAIADSDLKSSLGRLLNERVTAAAGSALDEAMKPAGETPAAPHTAPAAPDSGSSSTDYSDVCHPGARPGVVLCETPDSFAGCKAVEGRGKLMVEGDAPGRPTAVKQCQQVG
jgi:hypothetical protein